MAQEFGLGPSTQMVLPHEKMADHKSLWSLKRWFGKDETSSLSSLQENEMSPDSDLQRPGVSRRLSRKVIPGLPRPGTFRRQMSELRDNLEPTKTNPDERRTVSVDRRRSAQTRGISRPGVPPLPRTSAPVLLGTAQSVEAEAEPHAASAMPEQADDIKDPVRVLEEPLQPAPSCIDTHSMSADGFDDVLLDELERCWILNLSMHFRDRSNREKFFVTYAEKVNRWRRVTVSLDYRDAPRDSLEDELQHMQFQRDKSARIYESIRESLPDIQFYDTVTNLKLQTEQDRLHVHVTEDIHEVINYPPVTAISHLQCQQIREDALIFDSHLSGFVYKVMVQGHVFIKKEIPGPDTVEEFLYEINALYRLSGSNSVIHFGGVIVDNEEKYLKGLIISYAEKGALIDMIFDYKGQLPWSRRERWAKQIVHGLSEIHEAGFVQGDFTLSNIVIDAQDDAKIIDINRRGCPVGWEPPEVAALIGSRQRISMYIGVKSDIFQLGMVLWAIAMQQDEPELQPRPLTLDSAPLEIPTYFRELVGVCLSDDPRNRCHASALLSMFPAVIDDYGRAGNESQIADILRTQDVESADAPERHEIDNSEAMDLVSSQVAGDTQSNATHTYVNAPTDTSEEPYYYPGRGRSPAQADSRLDMTDILASNTDFGMENDGYVDNVHSKLNPSVINVSPSGLGRHTAAFEAMSEEQADTGCATEHPGQKPRATEAAPGMISGDLTGVGEHSSILVSEFPRSLDDELMTDPQ